MNKLVLIFLINFITLTFTKIININLSSGDKINILYAANYIKIFKFTKEFGKKTITYENGIFDKTLEFKLSSNQKIVGLYVKQNEKNQSDTVYKFVFINLETSEIKEFKISKEESLPELPNDWQIIADLPE